MLRKLMRAAVLAAALCALGAVTASAASAAGEFTVGATPAAITGTQATTNVFEVTNSAHTGFVKTKCGIATFEGTSTAAAATELTVTPKYTECTLGGLAAEVKMNGCKYTFTSTGVRTANVDITGCTEGKKIEIIKGNCTITIPQQGPLATVTFANNAEAGSKMDATATADVTAISNTQGTGSECPSPGLTSTDGTYTGTVTIKAFEDLGGKSATHNGHTYTELICGNQVSFTVD
jgi:hypothetical protein